MLLVSLFILLSAQTLLDMVENYPTALRTLILAENNISPELQQQISDLLSEGEEEEETEAREVTAREKNPWICQNSKSSGTWAGGRGQQAGIGVSGVFSAPPVSRGGVGEWGLSLLPCELESRQPPGVTFMLNSVGLSCAWKGSLQGQCGCCKEWKRYLRGVFPDAAGTKSLCKVLKLKGRSIKDLGGLCQIS